MRERLADWCCLMHLAHINPTECRVETWLESKTRLEREFVVRLHSIDFEILHYSAGVSHRVENRREHTSYRNCIARNCCSRSKNLFPFCREKAFKTFEGI
jgi:hypothetical protein